MVSTYEVGRPFHPDRRRWPDAIQWRLSEDGVQLGIFLADPSAAEVAAVTRGAARFALLAGDAALILAHRFEGMPWSDAPWQAVRDTGATAGLADRAPGEQQVVQVVLVDAATGLIAGLRLVSWPPRFADGVRAAIRRQLLGGATDAAGAAEIARWQRRYPATKDLVAAADLTTRARDA